MSNAFGAKVNVIVAAVDEWQRGAINQPELKRRCDLSSAGEAVLLSFVGGVSQYSPTERVREIAAKALAAS